MKKTWKTEFIDIEGTLLAYLEYGSGPVLLLLHGNSQSKKSFTKYQEIHFPQFRTIAVDTRGHGESGWGDEERFGFDRFSDDIIALCRALEIERAAVLGYSDGGNIALFLAKKEPELFSKVVAISPNYLVSGSTPGTLRLTRWVVNTLRFLGKLGIPTCRAVKRLNLMLEDIGISSVELTQIRTRLLILHAEHDMIQEEHVLDMGRLIPGAETRRIPHCNHLTITSKNETIIAVKDFLLDYRKHLDSVANVGPF